MAPAKKLSGSFGPATYAIEVSSDGVGTVSVTRGYAAGLSPSTADQVWRIISDFGGAKAIFPSLLGIYVSYAGPSDGLIGAVRHMTFAPANSAQPLSDANPLEAGIEQLTELDPAQKRLVYVSLFGLPLKNYRSEMQVSGADSCELSWVSSFTLDDASINFPSVLAEILAGGANHIAVKLGLR